MALITCSECGKQMSDKAAACPHCGNPKAAVVPVQTTPVQAVSVHSASNTPASDVNNGTNIVGREKKTGGRVFAKIVAIACFAYIGLTVIGMIISLAQGRFSIPFINILVSIVLGKSFWEIASGCRIEVTSTELRGKIPFKRKIKLPWNSIASAEKDAVDTVTVTTASSQKYVFKKVENVDLILNEVNRRLAQR